MWSAFNMLPFFNQLRCITVRIHDQDESTAIFKVTAKTSDLPAEGNWMALDADGHDLPSDWYLRLAGEAQKMLEGSRPFSATIPIDPETANPTKSPTSQPTKTPSKTQTAPISSTNDPTISSTKEPASSPLPGPTTNPIPVVCLCCHSMMFFSVCKYDSRLSDFISHS